MKLASQTQLGSEMYLPGCWKTDIIIVVLLVNMNLLDSFTCDYQCTDFYNIYVCLKFIFS